MDVSDKIAPCKIPIICPTSVKRKSWLEGFFNHLCVIMAVSRGSAIPGTLHQAQSQLAAGYCLYLYIRMLIHPMHELPTPAVQVASEDELPMPQVSNPTNTPAPTATLTPTVTPIFTPTATLVPTPIPAQIQLSPPAYDEVRDKQDINNCGPATLALYLRFFGWDGNQYDIAKIAKPESDDRNVNVEELVHYVRNYAGWLNIEFRVGGDLERIKELLAAGIPVMIEESFTVDRQYWREDDLWSGHYLLITGYDDAEQIFTTHDTELGPNQHIHYKKLDENWQSFNRVYIMVYPPEMENDIINILGEDWDADVNRQKALETAQRETQEDPQNAFAWFNLGTNLTYFERYNEAADAYDTARTIGLPQRMLRYQFGPFISYFPFLPHGRIADADQICTGNHTHLGRGHAVARLGFLSPR